MNKLVSLLERPSWIIALIACGLAALCAGLGTFGMYNGNFLSVLIAIIDTVLVVGVFVIGFIMLLKRKQEFFSIYAVAILAAGAVYVIGNLLSVSNGYGGLDDGLCVAAGFFVFAEVAAFIAALVLLVIAKWKNKDSLAPVAKIIGVAALIPGLIALIMLFIIFGRFQAGWTSYPAVIATLIAIPTAVIFSLFYAESIQLTPYTAAVEE